VEVFLLPRHSSGWGPPYFAGQGGCVDDSHKGKTLTDEKGFFRLARPSELKEGLLLFRKEGFPPQWHGIGKDEWAFRRWILESGMRLKGAVKEEGGKSFPEAEVLLFPLEPRSSKEKDSDFAERPVVFMFPCERRPEFRTDEGGEFELPLFLPGTYKILVASKGAVHETEPGVFEGTPQAMGQPLAVRVKSGWTISGRVLDTQGLPLAAASVDVSQEAPGRLNVRSRTSTDEKGYFSLLAPALPPAGVKAQSKGHVEGGAWPVYPQGGSLQIVLMKSAALSGRLLDDGGKPVFSASLRGRMQELKKPPAPDQKYLDYWIGKKEIKTDGKGEFILTDMRPGYYRLEFEAAGLAPLVTQVFQLAEGEEKNLGELRFSAGWTLEGTLRGTEGRPVSGAEIRLTDKGEMNVERTLKTESGGKGEYRIKGLLDGVYTVRIKHTDYAQAVFRNVEINGKTIGTGKAFTLDAVLGRGGRITGEVRGLDERPVEGVNIALQDLSAKWDSDDQPERAATDASGRFAIKNVRPGKWRLLTRAPGLGMHKDVALSEGETLEVLLQPEPVTVYGGCFGPDGGPLSATWIPDKVFENLDKLVMRSDSYVLGGLPPGSISMKMWIKDDTSSGRIAEVWETLEVPDSKTAVQRDFKMAGEISGRVTAPGCPEATVMGVYALPTALALKVPFDSIFPDGLAATITSERDGSFRLYVPRAGKYVLAVGSPWKTGEHFHALDEITIENGDVRQGVELQIPCPPRPKEQ
jgi:protocatechuate 3,4-dioxygenase beta subunit